nr:MAG TPA: hypothetical protein [Caudoviricetes sp.]
MDLSLNLTNTLCGVYSTIIIFSQTRFVNDLRRVLYET